MESSFQILGVVSGVLMPLFNIPLILRITRRRSSADISLAWVVGVWFCIVGMLPSSLQSADVVLYAFGVVNVVFFTGVLIAVLYFHPTIIKRKRRAD